MFNFDQIISFAANELNYNYNDSDINIDKYIKKCQDTFNSVEILNLFDEETLKSYEYFLNEMWYLIIDVIPVVFEVANVGTDEVPKKSFVKQFQSLDLTETFILLCWLEYRSLFNIKDDKLFKFIISSIKTLKVV